MIDKTKALQDKYPSAETQNLAKDAVVLMKKLEAVQNRGDKIADVLEASLEQHCQDAQVQEQRWINATKEKVAWCGDIAGDRYSMEAKLATIEVSQEKMLRLQYEFNQSHAIFRFNIRNELFMLYCNPECM